MTIHQLQMLDEISRVHGVSYDAALLLRQDIFGSLCYQRWVVWDIDRDKFMVSREGAEARHEQHDWAVHRKRNTLALAKRAKSMVRRHGLRRVA